MYVEKLQPPTESKQKYPLVFMTGGSQTGTDIELFEHTGWASYFLSLGYTVPSDGVVSITNVSFVQSYFTSVERFELWPQAHLHTQWPGTGETGDQTFDAFFASEIQQQTNTTKAAINNVNALVALLDKIGDAILISHSQADPYGWGVGDRRPDPVKGIIAIEPEDPPFENQITGTGPARPYGIATLPLKYDPPITDDDRSDCVVQQDPGKRLMNSARFPVLLYVSEASYHTYHNHCTLVFMAQAGMRVDYLELSEVGIHGNGHFSFMEKNNLRIAPLLNAWIQEVVH
ncbi:alpha/beta-hydrolase [Karstenula rhodostoma CBS 690.94]|uniref:Alpha/beta-hydrolase n=1 Tax=Karstenula rhodostoma CBS 690.94 TaxID=1392251 RepID=A0A9P4P836_9PLEO|nr:alpha/beta-hydrolase [Karstenula rhodostoma CBS 690.94]